MKKIIVSLAIIIIFVIGIIYFKFQSGSKTENSEISATPTIALPTVSESVKVDLVPKSNNQSVKITVAGLSKNIESVEYELTYTTGAGLPRGVIGKISTKGASEISRDDIVLGTCSSGKCVYDLGVTSVDLSLKFNTNEGSSVYRKNYQL
jgi:hypothetical protein